jgi:hypothetical protein
MMEEGESESTMDLDLIDQLSKPYEKTNTSARIKSNTV